MEGWAGRKDAVVIAQAIGTSRSQARAPERTTARHFLPPPAAAPASPVERRALHPGPAEQRTETPRSQSRPGRHDDESGLSYRLLAAATSRDRRQRRRRLAARQLGRLWQSPQQAADLSAGHTFARNDLAPSRQATPAVLR